jgi:hypothetical protein
MTTRAKDPIQQSLREKKALWNKKVSVLIENVIQLKQMMNGKVSKFSTEKSKITEPIPNNPASILSELMQDFTEILKEGNDIVSAQKDYSENRKKPTK